MDEGNGGTLARGGGRSIEAMTRDVSRMIGEITDEESAQEVADDMDLIEAMLRRSGEYGRYAALMCVLEFDLLARVASLDVEVTMRRGMVEWMRTLTGDALSGLREQCATGIRISSLKARATRAVNAEREEREEIEEYKRISGEFVQEALDMGKVTMNTEEFIDRWSLPRVPDKTMLRASVEHTKNELLRSGAVGLGDGGTYGHLEVLSRREAEESISNRLRSIASDVKALVVQCERVNSYVSHTAYEMIVGDLGSVTVGVGR